MTTHTPFTPDPAWPSIQELARLQWGEPNKPASKPDDIRFGSKGSKSVKPSTNTWFDHEADKGGGYLDLYQAVHGHLPPQPQGNGEARRQAFETRARNGEDQPKPQNGEAPHQASPEPWNDVATTYDYTEPDGNLILQVVRTISGTPRFRQRHRQGGKWLWSVKDLPNHDTLLYRLPGLLAAPPEATIWICEGEKDADRLYEELLISTTNIGGAGKWRDAYAPHFANRHVVILPDNDKPGQDHAQAIAASLAPVAASVRVLELPNLPPKGDVSDWLDQGGYGEQLEELARQTPLWTGTTGAFRRILTLSDLAALQDPNWLIDGLIPEKSLAVVFGPPKAGKSFIVLSAALHVAAGLPWFGRTTQYGAVVYIAGEGVGGLKNRTAAMLAAYGIQPLIPLWIIPRAVNFRIEAEVQALAELIQQTVTASSLSGAGATSSFTASSVSGTGVTPPKIAWVIIDTLARSIPGGDENSAQDLGLFIAQCDWLKAELNCCVTPIHHTGKDENRGARGSSALHGALDTALKITNGAKKVRLEVTDQKDAEAGLVMSFEMQETTVSLTRTSLVPVLTSNDDVAAQHRRPGGNAGIALNTLENLLAESTAAILPPFKGIPSNVRGTQIDLWRKAFYTHLPGQEQEAKKKAFQRAVAHLQEAKLVGVHDPWIWLVE